MIAITIKQADGSHYPTVLCMNFDAATTEDGMMSIILYSDQAGEHMSHFFGEVTFCRVVHQDEGTSN